MISRRGFLAGILAGAAAPAIVRASSLMKLPKTKHGIVLLDPRHFGNMAWKPELVRVMSSTTKEQRQLEVQPMFKHITNLPILESEMRELRLVDVFGKPIVKRSAVITSGNVDFLDIYGDYGILS